MENKNIKNLDLRKCFIIAEIGVNHNGDIDLAKKMISSAKESGANAVKFQTFTAESLVSPSTPKVKYQMNTTNKKESHYEMIERLQLSRRDHFILNSYCQKLDITFLSTPYDISSAIFLDQEINVPIFKTASADIVDIPLQTYIASTRKPSFVSVGMASLGEIEEVNNIYKPESDLVFLHCTSNYPSSDESLNLNVITTLAQCFQRQVGYSDHSNGSLASISSVALGAKVIEKHFTLDKSLPGPDHLTSLNKDEFSNFIRDIRRIEKMLGSSVKKCQEEEKEMSLVSRKSIHLSRSISKGEIVKEEDFCLMRPGTGLKYIALENLIGKVANRDLSKGEKISYSDFL